MRYAIAVTVTLAVLYAPAARPLSAVEASLRLVVDGKPSAVVVVADPPESAPKKSRRKRKEMTDEAVAEVLVGWVRKITGAALPVAGKPAAGRPAVYVGAAAVGAGLRLDDIGSASGEGMRIVAGDSRVLIAGQCPAATLKAVCRFLEELGCRYFMEGPLGEIYPEQKTLAVPVLDITDKPGFLSRRIWGSTWSGRSLWKTWNGAGGIRLHTGHSWGSYIPKKLFDEHPGYFRMDGEGTRRPSQWLCTSNDALRAAFAARVSAAIAAGTGHPSISPPDGRGYCRCPACRAQDDPDAREPSTGAVCMTNRYVDFFDDVARRVAADHPGAILNFYAKFFGPRAGPHMKTYWSAVDDAGKRLRCHAGSFFAIHNLYTPRLLATCRRHLAAAAAAARDDGRFAERVALHREGFRNAVACAEIREAMNRGDFTRAKDLCDRLLARNEALVSRKLSNHYTPRYVRRFLGKIVEAGAAATAAPNRLVAVLPDRWRLAYDPDDAGEQKGYAKPGFDDGGWKEVAMYSDTLNAQGLPDRKTVMWYRARFDVPPGTENPALFFAEIDGTAAVFVNGRPVGQQQKKRAPFTVAIGAAARFGANVVAVRVDHSTITELDLGGILRPVLLIARGG